MIFEVRRAYMRAKTTILQFIANKFRISKNWKLKILITFFYSN